MNGVTIAANVLRANVTKVVTEMLRYLPNTISLVLTFYVVFLAMFLGIHVVGDPQAAGESVRYLIVANAFWLLLMLGINSMGFEVTNEATRGTLEQLYMSPVPAWQILLSRMAGTLGANLVIMALMVALSMATAGTWLNLDLPLVLLILLPTLVAVSGLGFAVAGLALVFKQIQSLLQVMQFVFLGLAFVPLALSPWLALAPVVKGIDMVRTVMVEGAGFASFGAADWAVLVGNAAAYFALGLIAFRAAERRAMARGLLGQY